MDGQFRNTNGQFGEREWSVRGYGGSAWGSRGSVKGYGGSVWGSKVSVKGHGGSARGFRGSVRDTEVQLGDPEGQ